MLRLLHQRSQKSHMGLFCRIQVTDDLELIGILMITILTDEKFPFLSFFTVILPFSRCVPFLPDLQVGFFLTWAVNSQLFFFFSFVSPASLSLLLISHIHAYISCGIFSLEQKVVFLGWELWCFHGMGSFVSAKVMIRVWLREEPLLGN